MKHTKSRFLAVALPVLLTAIGLWAAAPLPSEYYRVKAVYQAQIEMIEAKRDRELDTVAERHVEAMKSLEKGFQLSGDLKPLLAVRKERARFESNPSIKDIAPNEELPALASLQTRYVQEYKAAQLAAAQQLLDLSQHYKRRLTALQKDLTREGKIDEALAVLAKVDELPTSPEVLAARKQIDSGGMEPTSRHRAPSSRRQPVDIDLLSRHFHGKVVGWNSITQEITLKYDFQNEEELKDWEGATIDPLRQRIVCDHNVVWFKAPFRSISRLESEAALYSGEGPIRIVLSQSLYVELESGTDGQALIHQGNPSYPLMKSHGGAQPYIKYNSILTLDDQEVQWTMGRRSFPASRIQQPLRPPLRVGFGDEASKTMFGNIVIKGVLSQSVMDALP